MKKVLSSMLALTLCVGAFGFPVNVASANSEEPAGTAAGTFKMAETAQVCISDPGIRFRVEIANDVVETAKAADDFGFLVFPHEYLATAKANVEANAELQYHDKFDGTLGEGNVVPTDKVGTYGLFDYAETSMEDEVLAEAVYTDAKDGKQYVNVIYQDDVEENRDVELTALAWYRNGETYTYAELNDSFSRSVAYVLQQEYIAGDYSRAEMMKKFSWLKEDTFEIRSGEDMEDLSKAVEGGEAFENINFALTTSVVADGGYKQVPNTFKGNFDYNGKKIFIVNNENESAFAENTNATLENVNDKVVDEYLLQANEANKAAFNGSASEFDSTHSSFVEEATLGGEKVPALKFNFTSTGNWYVSAKLDYTAEEIELLREYVAPYVTFRAYVEAPEGSTLKLNTNFVGAFNLCGYAGLDGYVKTNCWLDLGLSLNDVIAMLDTRNNEYYSSYGDAYKDTLFLGRLAPSLAEGVNLYITDVTFADELPEFQIPIDPTVFAVNGGTVTTALEHEVATELPGEGKPDSAIKVSVPGAGDGAVTIKPAYTKAQLQTILDNGWFDTITFKMYVVSDGAVKSRNDNYLLSKAVGGQNIVLTKGQWITYTVSISDCLDSTNAVIKTNGEWQLIRLGKIVQEITFYFGDVTLTKSASSAQ